jgi:exonuclease VII small subunit
MGDNMDQLEDIVSRLETIAEELNDYSMRILSDAIEAGESTRPPLEKQVSQARRAVEKALQHLGKN